MAAPDNRVPVRLARGTKATLLANIADLYEGEICYATDENICYVKEGAGLEPASGGAASLGELSDVDLTTPATEGQSLVWSVADSAFIPGNPPASTLDDLTDVDTSTVPPTDGQVLTWNNADSEWQPADASTVASINDLTDVDTATVAPTDGQVLTWNNTDSEWQPADASGGGGAGTPGTAGQVSASDGNTVTPAFANRDIDALVKGGGIDGLSVVLNFEGDGTDFPAVDTANMVSTFPSTDAKWGTGGATFDRANNEWLEFEYPKRLAEQGVMSQLGISERKWTISFWYKSDDTEVDTQGDSRILLGTQNTTSQSTALIIRVIPQAGAFINPHADNAHGAICLSPRGNTSTYICGTRTVVMNDNVWHYVALQHEGDGTYSCFVDGNLTERVTLAEPIDFVDNGGFRLGGGSSYQGNKITGSIDSFTIAVDYVESTGSTMTVPAAAAPSENYGDGASLMDLADVYIDTTLYPDYWDLDGLGLVYNERKRAWVPGGPTTLGSIGDVSFSGSSSMGFGLIWDSGNDIWVPDGRKVPTYDKSKHIVDSSDKTILNLVVPQYVSEHELMLAFVITRSDLADITAPAGWGFFGTITTLSNTGQKLLMYSKEVDADDVANDGVKTYTWTQAVAGVFSGSTILVEGRNHQGRPSVRDIAANFSNGGSTSLSAPGGYESLFVAMWEETSASETYEFTATTHITNVTFPFSPTNNARHQVGLTTYGNNTVTSTHGTTTTSGSSNHVLVRIDLEHSPAGTYVPLATLKEEVAAATDFADFQSRVANMAYYLVPHNPMSY